MSIRLKTAQSAPTNRYEDRDNWRLVDKKRLLELRPGFVAQTNNGERVVITSLHPPLKESSQGKVVVQPTGDRRGSMSYYASVIGAEFQYQGGES